MKVFPRGVKGSIERGKPWNLINEEPGYWHRREEERRRG
jgi:hypothetical protein